MRLASITRYLRIYRMFMRNCLVRELQFRANFLVQMAMVLLWVSYNVLTDELIYSNTTALAGWNEGQVLVLIGSYTLVTGLIYLICYENWHEFPRQVAMGTFDLVLTKPVDSQFLAYCRYVNWAQISRVLSAFVLIAYGFHRSGAAFHWSLLAWYLPLVTCGFLIHFSLYSLLVTTTFWLVRVEHLTVAMDSFMIVAKYPDDIYHQAVRLLLNTALPLAFVAAVPARALTGRLDSSTLVTGVTVTLVLVVISRLFWQRAVASYSSAGG